MSRLKETYLLIKFMSSGEKRFFNIFSNRYTTTKTIIKLFNTLESFEEWDNLKVLKAINKQKIQSGLSGNITNLINEITTALRLHNETNIIDLEINKHIEEARLLSKQNLLELGSTKLNKAEKLAIGAEKHERLLEILRLKRVFSIRNLNNEDTHELCTKLSLERLNLLKVIENREQYLLLSQEIFYLYRKYGNPSNQKQKDRFEDIIKNPLMKDISLTLSTNAANSYYFIYTVYYTIFHKLDKALEIIEKQVEVLENKKKYLRNNLDQYISVLNNAIYINSKLRDDKKFFISINKLRNLPEKYNLKNKYFKKRVFETSYSLELDYYIQSSQYDKLNILSISLEKKLFTLSKKGLSKDKFVSFSYSISLNFYYTENFKKAQDVLSNLMLIDDKKTNLQWFYFAKVLELIIHLELKNYKLLLSRIKSVKRFLKINNILDELDIEFLKLLKNIPTSYDPEKDYKNFINHVDKSADDETKKYYTDYLKIQIWCSSKIKNTSFTKELFSLKS